MRFECPGCDTILTRDAALKHTKHGGICNTMYPIRHETKSADDHDKEEKVDKLQNKEKKVDEIAKADEDKIKRIEEIKRSLRGLSAEELDDELEKLKADLEELKKNQTEDKDEDKQSISSSIEHVGYDNSNSKYSVLTYNVNSIESREGDSLLIKMGSTDNSTKGDSSADDLLISLGSSD